MLERNVQDLPLEIFGQLACGDVLFIDSSHVAKTGSDVNDLFFRILPQLASGVWIHLHDVHYPFEYPEQWVYEGRSWNESYLLRAFLQYNTRFRVELFNSYLSVHHPERWEVAMPPAARTAGGSIWLRKL